MKTSSHRQNKNRAETEQEWVGGGVGEMGRLAGAHDLLTGCWFTCGNKRQRRGRAGIPRAGHWFTQAGAMVALRQKHPHSTHLCTDSQTLPAPQG